MVEHVNIADGQRHEPKGASTALLNQVAHATGTGSTVWKFIDYSTIVNPPTPFSPLSVLSAYSSASQSPTAVDTPLQVNFGSPQTTTHVSLAANGTLTFNTAGTYTVTLFLRFGRTTGAGNAILVSRFLINDVQGLNSNAISMPDSNSIVPFSTTLMFTVTAGTTFKLQILRDSSGINNGGLFALTPVLSGWNVAPSATLVVSKLTG